MGTWTILALVLMLAAFILAVLEPAPGRNHAVSVVLAICAAGILIAFAGG